MDAVFAGTSAKTSMPCWMAAGSVAAMAWAWMMARRKAAAVFGFFFSQLAVAMYPLIGRFSVVPWLLSASGIAPAFSSASVMNGSGAHMASTLCCWRAFTMSGNGTGTNVTLFTGTALSLRTELTSNWPMFCVTLTAIFLPCRSLSVLMPEPGRTMMSWLFASMIEPGARTRKSAGFFSPTRWGSALARM